jgi:hypothetical protein
MSTRDNLRRIDSALTTMVGSYQARHGVLPHGACLHEKVDRRTPLDELMDAEQRAGLRETLTPFEELDGHAEELGKEGPEAVALMLEAHFWLLDFLFAEGPHPGVVMRRLYAWVKKYRPSAIWDAGYRQLGDLLGESHAAMEWRIGQIIDNYATSKGMKGVKMPWQRGAAVSETLSKAQRGNVNRLGGQKCRKSKKRKTNKRK